MNHISLKKKAGLGVNDVLAWLIDPHIYMQDNITLDNFDEVLTSLSGAVRGAATNVSEQTTNNLAITSAVFMRIAELINTTTIIQDEVYILSCLVCNNRFNLSSPYPFSQHKTWSEYWAVSKNGILMYCKQMPQSEYEQYWYIFALHVQLSSSGAINP